MKNFKIGISLLLLFMLSFGQMTVAGSVNLSNVVENDSVIDNDFNFSSDILESLSTINTVLVEVKKIEIEHELKDFNSSWTWPEFTLEMLESYTPFIFRTKNSASLDEVRVILNVNEKGKLVGYELLTEADRGLEQRIAHVLRKLPNCLPMPGHTDYGPTDFELIIKK